MHVIDLYTWRRSAEVDGELRATHDLTPVEEAQHEIHHSHNNANSSGHRDGGRLHLDGLRTLQVVMSN